MRIDWKVLTLGIALANTTAHADIAGDIAPFVGLGTGGGFDDTASGGDLDLDDAAVFGVALHLESRLGGNYEFYLLRQQTDISGASTPGTAPLDIDITYFQFGGNYPLSHDGALTPYAILTVGGVRYDPKAAELDSETFFAATGGVGLDVELGETLSLRFEGRAHFTWLDGDESFFCVSGPGIDCAIEASGSSTTQWTATAGLAWYF